MLKNPFKSQKSSKRQLKKKATRQSLLKATKTISDKKVTDLEFEVEFKKSKPSVSSKKQTADKANLKGISKQNDLDKPVGDKSLLPATISNPLQQIDSIQSNLNRTKLIFQRIRVYLFLFTFMFLIMTIGVIAYFYSKNSGGKYKHLIPNTIDKNTEEIQVTSWLFDKKRAPWNFSFFPIDKFAHDNPTLTSYLPAIRFNPLSLTKYHHIEQISILFQQRSAAAAGSLTFSNSIWTSVIGTCVVDYDTSVLITGNRTDVFQLQGPWTFGNKFLDCEVPMFLYTQEAPQPRVKFYQIHTLTFTYCSLSALGGFVQLSNTINITNPAYVDGTPLLMYPRIVEIDNNDNIKNLPYDLTFTIEINKDGGDDDDNSPRTVTLHPDDFNQNVTSDLTQLTISLTGPSTADQVLKFVKNSDPSPQTPSDDNVFRTTQFYVENFY